MKMDQIAFYCADALAADMVKKKFGLEKADWVHDTVTAKSSVWGFEPETNVAELQFNYDLGVELEILRYIEGPSWHGLNAQLRLPFISHIGIHLDDGEEFPAMTGCRLVQETFTQSHTAAYLTTGPAAGRKYHYRIFELGHSTFIKYIRRIHP